MVKVASLGSWSPTFDPLSIVELTPGGVDSACHPSEVSEMGTSVLGYSPFGVTCVGVATCPGLYSLPMKLHWQPDAPWQPDSTVFLV